MPANAFFGYGTKSLPQICSRQVTRPRFRYHLPHVSGEVGVDKMHCIALHLGRGGAKIEMPSGSSKCY